MGNSLQKKKENWESIFRLFMRISGLIANTVIKTTQSKEVLKSI